MENPFRHFPIVRYLIFAPARKRLEIHGEEHIPRETPYLIVANHQSYLDPPIVGTVFIPKIRRKLGFLAKESVYKGFGKLFAAWFGMIGVDPENRSGSLAAAERWIARRDPVVIFPEGKRNYDPKTLLRAKTGAARLALAHGLRVVPVGIIAPEGRTTKRSIRDFFFSRKRLIVRIGEPIRIERHEGELTREMLDDTSRTMMRTIGALCGKSYPY
jgi:1-acyl-sn-glycerol-3-phosphate acyltransferase